MSTKRRTMVLVLIAILAVPGLASAIRKSRLVGRVLDPDGNPISGVAVDVTCPQDQSFHEMETTDKKGVFKVDFEELNVTYKYKFQKAGYQNLMVDQNWSLEGTKRLDFTMTPGQSPTGTAGPPTSTSSPAIDAFNSGVKAFENKDYKKAEALFEEALGHDPEFRQAWGALSVVHLEQGHYQDAVETAEKAIALGSTNDMVLRSRWEAYRNLGDEAKAEQARKDLEQTGRLTEEAKRIYNEGVKLGKAGDQEGAFALFQEAIETDRNLEVALLAVATTGVKIGKYAEAVAAANTILEEDPQNTDAIRIRYHAALSLGDDDVLIDSLVDLAVVEPEIARAGLWKLALDSYDGGDSVQAALRFRKVLEVDPNYPWANYLLGLVLMGEGDNQEAISYLERFIELAPEDPEAPSAQDLVAYLRENQS